jgi:glycosyl transferase, family 25
VKCYVINLDQDLLRLEHVREVFGRSRLAFERFPAVDGRQLTADQRSLLPSRTRRREWTAGEIGCLLSHYELWRRVATGNDGLATIFEDDVFLSPKLAALLAQLERTPPQGSLLIKLDTNSHWVELDRRPVSRPSGIALHRLRSLHHGCAGYVVSRQAARMLVARIGAFDLPVDNVLFGPHPVSADVRVLQAVPALVVQSDVVTGLTGPQALGGSIRDERDAAMAALRRNAAREVDRLRLLRLPLQLAARAFRKARVLTWRWGGKVPLDPGTLTDQVRPPFGK